MREPDDTHSFSATLLDEGTESDASALADLQADPVIEVVDSLTEQRAALNDLRPGPDPAMSGEPHRWAFYPWRRAVVKILGPLSFRRLRLDRNRNLITGDEQDRLGDLRVGIVGLSSGHVIAHTLAAQGLCGELHLADFDDLELSNLNRVPAGVFDIGTNKATVAARRIAELDPYLSVRPWHRGLTPENVGSFLDGLDVVVEECDSLDIKALVRQEARARRLPVVMATSDRGQIDVERFDQEPGRPLFHGLLGTVDVARLRSLSSQEKVPQVLRLVDVAGLSVRAAASILEVGQSLATWPQLAGDVTLGAGGVAEAVRRIGLGQPLKSGRIRLDVGDALDRIENPVSMAKGDEPAPDDRDVPTDLLGAVVAAASRAPSGGNVQPWTIEAHGDTVEILLTPELTSTMDVGFRGSAVALGAAVFNASVAAAAAGRGDVVGEVSYVEPAGRWPLRASVRLTPGSDPTRASWYPAVLRRETNRHMGTPTAVAGDVLDALGAAASGEGAGLLVLTERAQIESAAEILGAADRIRYLTPALHADMTAELRWPGHDPIDTGIDVRSLELDDGTLLALDILKRPEVMASLREWDAGRILGADTRARVEASSALAIVTVGGADLTAYARGGSAAESVWVTAQDRGLSVQPISPPFLYARTDDELNEVSATYAAALSKLRSRLFDLAGVGETTPALLLRLAVTPPTSVTSRRRGVNIAGPGYSGPDVRG